MTTRLPVLLQALLVLLVPACVGPDHAGDQPAAANADKSAASKAEKRAAELEQARLQLQIAELEAAFAASSAEDAVALARHELEEAERALERFRTYEQPTELTVSQLNLERDEHRRLQDQQELEQMEQMYAQETNLDSTGEKTRDMVLERHRKALEFSTRALELTRARVEDQRQRDLPRKLRELESKVDQARIALRKAEEKASKGQLESKLALLKAQARVRELERGEEGDGKDAAGGEEAGR